MPGVSAFGAGYLLAPLPEPTEPDEDDGDAPAPWLYLDLLLCQACGHGVLAAQEDGVPLSRAVAALAAVAAERRGCPACAGEAVPLAEAMEIEGADALLVGLDASTGAPVQGWLCASCGAVEATLGRDAAAPAARIAARSAPVPGRTCLACGSTRVHPAGLDVNHAGDVYVPLRGVEDASNPRLGAEVCAGCAALSFQAAMVVKVTLRES